MTQGTEPGIIFTPKTGGQPMSFYAAKPQPYEVANLQGIQFGGTDPRPHVEPNPRNETVDDEIWGFTENSVWGQQHFGLAPFEAELILGACGEYGVTLTKNDVAALRDALTAWLGGSE